MNFGIHLNTCISTTDCSKCEWWLPHCIQPGVSHGKSDARIQHCHGDSSKPPALPSNLSRCFYPDAPLGSIHSKSNLNLKMMKYCWKKLWFLISSLLWCSDKMRTILILQEIQTQSGFYPDFNIMLGYWNLSPSWNHHCYWIFDGTIERLVFPSLCGLRDFCF